jgi:hypothetical protein
MLYRRLAKSRFNVSILGLGAMRLPIQGGTQSPADRFNTCLCFIQVQTLPLPGGRCPGHCTLNNDFRNRFVLSGFQKSIQLVSHPLKL